MPKDFGKKLTLKHGDIKIRVMGELDSHSMERQKPKH
jgi:hypothetical protein